jgi:hypothetical protein
MRILNDETEEPLKKVSLFVTRDEALDLYRSLDYHLRNGQPIHGWHTEFESFDGRDKTFFLGIYDPDDPEFDARWRAFFKDDVWTKAEPRS